jgi:hypothetical protein
VTVVPKGLAVPNADPNPPNGATTILLNYN